MQNTKMGGVKYIYRGADKCLARPGRKQANFSVRMAWISFGALRCRKKLDDSSRLDVVEIARVPDMPPSLFLSGRAKDLSAPRYIYSIFLDEGDYPWIWYHVDWYIDINLSEIFAASIFRVFCLACPEDGGSSLLQNSTFISISMA